MDNQIIMNNKIMNVWESDMTIGCFNWDIENYVAVLCIDNVWRLWPEVLL